MKQLEIDPLTAPGAHQAELLRIPSGSARKLEIMDTIEYRTIDKSAWERGPWDDEPDKKQWRDPSTGLACLIVRGPLGALCGYVGVPSGHPWHGKDYDDCGTYMPKPEGYEDDWYPRVHGGLTFAKGCGHSSDPAYGICHIPGADQPDDAWWLGFDCAHCDDYTSMTHTDAYRAQWPSRGQIYRDQAYVEREVAQLAWQAAHVATPSQ